MSVGLGGEPSGLAAEPFGPGIPMVVDTSAWIRQANPDVAPRWKATLSEGLIVSCPATALEILTGARDEGEFARLDAALRSLPQAPVTEAVCEAAIGASRELRGSRRLPAVDYLVAAAAADRGFGVLHCDSHYDVLAGVLGFESIAISE